jgi:hypothetical protein
VALTAALGALFLVPRSGGASAAPDGLAAFRSEAELRRYLEKLKLPVRKKVAYDMAPPLSVQVSPSSNEPAAVTLPGITNNQEAGVDEGGIVKNAGDMLVILRRGRLFTVSTAGGAMRPLDSIDAFPPGTDAGADWYDEVLIAGDRIAVIGFSYGRGGTVINRFRLGADGKLGFTDAYDLRSNDYYSSRNYASRLIGSKLVFYAPLSLGWDKDPLETLPAMRRWEPGGRFRTIAKAADVYLPPRWAGVTERDETALHTVTTCDVAAPVLDCSSVAVLGPWSRSFYVSPSAVYVWLSGEEWPGDDAPQRPSFLYRLPFDSARPSAIATRGAPIDQFSFREDRADGVLNVVVQSQGGGDAMWSPEFSEGRLALLRLPLDAFGGERGAARRRWYRSLPRVESGSWSLHNRFVGPWLLYGAGAFDAPPKAASLLVAAPLKGGSDVRFTLPHGVDRIEALGGDALAVGASGGGLGFTTIELGAGAARLGDRYTLERAAEGENRSHAFFFRAASADGADGLLGLPVTKAAEAEPADRFLGSAASIHFLRREDRRLAPAGALEARPSRQADDGCTASCVDWYGNARPIFLRNRTFALLGYEIVEGRLEGGRIREVARVSFAPRPRRSARLPEAAGLVP